MSTGKQQRPVKMFNKKPGEENSPKPADENKQVTVPLKDFQSLQKTEQEYHHLAMSKTFTKK